MYTGRKKISAAVLILLLAIPLLYSVVFTVQQKLWQISSRLKFDTEIVQTLSLSKADIHWVKKNKEALIDGKYFDVKSHRISGNRILLTGYFDHKEDKLVRIFQKIFQKKAPTESTTGNPGPKLFFPLYTAVSGSSLLPVPATGDQPCCRYAETLVESYIPEFSPPPES